MQKMKIKESELIFRKVKERERLEFYQNAMEAVNEYATSSLGFNWDSFKRLLKINRLTFGLIAKIFMKNMIDYVIIYQDKMIAGYTIITEKEKYELGNVFTIPDYQGRGVASILMNRVLTEYSDNPIRLDVNVKNEVAIHIYKKYGFEEIERTKEFIEELPFPTKPFTNGFSARLLEKEDIELLKKALNEIPKIDLITKAYNKALKKKKKKRKLQIDNQVPCVLLKNDKIVGIGRAMWSKNIPNTAFINASAILQEANEQYPTFLTFITNELISYDIKKFIWNLTEKTKPFEKSLVPFLSEPARESIIMEKKID
ncbi:MAG: GNAT family N-acetyltransferase [Candidatus Heimdallarchaeota archaeon]